MKKIIAILFLTAFVISPVASFAQTVGTSASAPTLTDAQLKAKLLSVKKKQNKTKSYLKTNKAQVKATIKKVKKARTLKKAKMLKAKNITPVKTN